MKLQIVSDLHIETKREQVKLADYVTPVGDILVLAGDIGSMYRTRQLCNLLEQACQQFPHWKNQFRQLFDRVHTPDRDAPFFPAALRARI